MRREFFSLVVMTVCIVTIAASNAYASSGGIPGIFKDKKEPKKVSPSPKPQSPVSRRKPASRKAKPASAVARDLAKERALIQRKRLALNNTEWDIELIPLTGKGRKKKDTITFSEGRVSTKNLSKEGFPPTNFSLSRKTNDKLVWETMQKNDLDIVFFKGEVVEDLQSMRGVISFQRVEGTKDYSFVSTLKRETGPQESAAE